MHTLGLAKIRTGACLSAQGFRLNLQKAQSLTEMHTNACAAESFESRDHRTPYQNWLGQGLQTLGLSNAKCVMAELSPKGNSAWPRLFRG